MLTVNAVAALLEDWLTSFHFLDCVCFCQASAGGGFNSVLTCLDLARDAGEVVRCTNRM